MAGGGEFERGRVQTEDPEGSAKNDAKNEATAKQLAHDIAKANSQKPLGEPRG